MTAEVQISNFMPNGLIVARCIDCRWRRETKTSNTGAARKHVEQTGHTVRICRSQYKVVRPMPTAVRS